jgi:hypothetical protein
MRLRVPQDLADDPSVARRDLSSWVDPVVVVMLVVAAIVIAGALLDDRDGSVFFIG